MARGVRDLASDERGIVYAIIVLFLALGVFYFLYLLTYNMVMVEANFSDTAPPEVIKSVDNQWNLLPYLVIGGIGLWFIAYAIRRQGRWGGGF
ncbi:hypothetical protein [Geoglobus ahangari]